jgi:hypothetical protein
MPQRISEDDTHAARRFETTLADRRLEAPQLRRSVFCRVAVAFS